MTDIRDILSKALPEHSPPISIDRDTAVAAGRRARTRRTWLVTVTAGISTLLAGGTVAGGLTWALAGGSTLDIGEPSLTAVPTQMPAPSTTSGTPWPWPSSWPPPSAGHSTPADVGVSEFNVKPQLSAALQAALTQVAPGVSSEPAKEAFAKQDVAPFAVVASQGGFKTFAELRDSQGVGNFFAYLSTKDFAAQVAAMSSACAAQPAGATCTSRDGPNGELILIQQEPPRSGVITYQVSVAKPDGTVIDATLDNYSHNDQSGASHPHPDRVTPPLTVDQLIQLLLVPRVTLAS